MGEWCGASTVRFEKTVPGSLSIAKRSFCLDSSFDVELDAEKPDFSGLDGNRELTFCTTPQCDDSYPITGFVVLKAVGK